MSESYNLHFEREPYNDDPIQFVKYLYSEADFIRMLIDAMKQSNVNPAHIYAVKKTNLYISETNADKATGASLLAWKNAVDEYIKHGSDPSIGTEEKEFDELLSSLIGEIDSLIFSFGLANDKFLNQSFSQTKYKSGQVVSPSQYQALCIVRTHCTLRSIRSLIKEHMSDDVLKLARSIYENYLHLTYIHANPENIKDLVDAKVGIRSGTHQYKTTESGKQDKRTIVELSSGIEYFGHISAYAMAKSSIIESDVDFFSFFYESTSEYLHPSVFTLWGYLSGKGLDPLSPHVYEEGIIFSTLVSAMNANCILLIDGCPASVAKDVKTVVNRAKKKILRIIKLKMHSRAIIQGQLKNIKIIEHRCKDL